MPYVPVLLKTETDRQLVYTTVDPSQTAAELKAQVAQLTGLPPACLKQVSYQGDSLPDNQQLSRSGISSCTATLQATGAQLFPNTWFEYPPHTKTFSKVLDVTSPLLRQADYSLPLTWVAAVLAALLGVNSIL